MQLKENTRTVLLPPVQGPLPEQDEECVRKLASALTERCTHLQSAAALCPHSQASCSSAVQTTTLMGGISVLESWAGFPG